MHSYPRELLTYATIAVVALVALFIGVRIFGVWHDEWSGYNASVMIGDGMCNIAVLPIVGEITSIDYAVTTDEFGNPLIPYTSADYATALLRQAENDPSIQGILVRIDSPGGYPTGSEIITDAVKRSMLPSVALIRESGTSGGYMIATGADTIIASRYSDVGSIGLTMSYLENTEQNTAQGLSYVPLTSAPFKDYMSPDKPLTAEERALLERDLEIWHTHFVEDVAENRGMTLEEAAALADGSSMPGALALEAGLVDQLGDQETAREWFAELLKLDPEEIIFCE